MNGQHVLESLVANSLVLGPHKRATCKTQLLPVNQMCMDFKNDSFISNEDIGEIAGVSNFSGFLNASDVNKALETSPALNLSVILEDESSGDTNQPTEVELHSQEQVEEPQANSTLLESVEVPVETSPG